MNFLKGCFVFRTESEAKVGLRHYHDVMTFGCLRWRLSRFRDGNDADDGNDVDDGVDDDDDDVDDGVDDYDVDDDDDDDGSQLVSL